MTIRDPEVVLELRSEPELLALADALADALRDRSRRRRRRLLPATAVAAAAAAAAGFALVGRGPEPGLVDRALAAVGGGPVLHAVVRETVPPDPNWTFVEIATGRRLPARPRTVETELWVERERNLAHTIVRTDGRVTDNVLHTREGEWSQDGIVWTCASIARHPLEATRDRVSCNLSGDNGATPRDVPEALPAVDPALAAFVDGYREALQRGRATRIGDGHVHGTQVTWLGLGNERVAIDRESYKPLEVEVLAEGKVVRTYAVLQIETIPESEADFARPPLLPAKDRIVVGEVVGRESIPLEKAPEVVDGAVWPGPEVAGLRLALVERQEVTTGYARDTGLAPARDATLTLVYGETQRGRPTGSHVVINESAHPEFAYGWDVRHDPLPAEGLVRLGPFAGWAFLRRDGIYVAIRGTVGEDGVLAAIRALVPISAGAR